MRDKMTTAAAICYAWYVIWACLGLVFWDSLWAFYILSAVLIFDIITWWLKSIRMKRFSTSDLKRWIASKLIWLGIVLLLWIILENRFPTSAVPENLIAVILWLTIVAEMISVVQNATIIRSWQDIEERDSVSELYNFVLTILRTTFQNIKKIYTLWWKDETDIKTKE